MKRARLSLQWEMLPRQNCPDSSILDSHTVLLHDGNKANPLLRIPFGRVAVVDIVLARVHGLTVTLVGVHSRLSLFLNGAQSMRLVSVLGRLLRRIVYDPGLSVLVSSRHGSEILLRIVKEFDTVVLVDGSLSVMKRNVIVFVLVERSPLRVISRRRSWSFVLVRLSLVRSRGRRRSLNALINRVLRMSRS